MDAALLARSRRPSVSGYYYPEDPELLQEAVDRLLQGAGAKVRARGVVVPHGSLRHAGTVMGATLRRLNVPRRCIIVGASHTGGNALRWSCLARGAYRTPLGTVEVDEPLVDALRARCPWLEPDPWGQRGEHAIEVVLPFLQRAQREGISIVPILTTTDCLEECTALGEALAECLVGQEGLLVASSDLSHYETVVSGAAKDRHLIETMCRLDVPGLLRTVQEEAVVMCGAGAVASVLTASARLGATRGELAGYGTSVAAGDDPYSVTGYAGILLR